MKEIWKETSVSGYYISNFGRIKGRTNRILKPQVNKSNGYLQISVRLSGRNSKSKCLKLHREVASAFIANPNNLPQVNHIDGNKSNNHVDNLEWCTNQENTIHAWNNGLIKAVKGSNNVQSKISEEDVKYIRTHFISGDSEFGYRALARKFNMSHKAIMKLVKNISYVE